MALSGSKRNDACRDDVSGLLYDPRARRRHALSRLSARGVRLSADAV